MQTDCEAALSHLTKVGLRDQRPGDLIGARVVRARQKHWRKAAKQKMSLARRCGCTSHAATCKPSLGSRNSARLRFSIIDATLNRQRCISRSRKRFWTFNAGFRSLVAVILLIGARFGYADEAKVRRSVR